MSRTWKRYGVSVSGTGVVLRRGDPSHSLFSSPRTRGRSRASATAGWESARRRLSFTSNSFRATIPRPITTPHSDKCMRSFHLHAIGNSGRFTRQHRRLSSKIAYRDVMGVGAPESRRVRFGRSHVDYWRPRNSDALMDASEVVRLAQIYDLGRLSQLRHELL